MAILDPHIPVVHVYPRDTTVPRNLESVNLFKLTDDSFTMTNLICALQTCRNEESPHQAKHLHACLCELGMDSHEVLESHLVPMLTECGCILDAQNVFNKSSKRSEYSWTSLIQGYVESGELHHTFNLYDQMQDEFIQPSHFTYVALLKGCCRWRSVDKAMEIHTMTVVEGCESNLFVGSTLIDMYARCGFLLEAQFVFQNVPANVVSWTAIISGYIEHGYGAEALDSLEQMQSEGLHLDSVILNRGLKACSITEALERGQSLHADVIRKGFESELLLANTLVDMYATCGSLVEAQYVHDNLHNRDTITWTALLVGYVENGSEKEALNCLEIMQLEGVVLDDAALICGLKVCGAVKALIKGQELHIKCIQQGVGSSSHVGSALVDMYVKCGLIVEARATINKLYAKDVVLWNVLMEGCAEFGLYEQALDYLRLMQDEGVSPDCVTFICGMKCCGASEEQAHDMHSQIFKRGFEHDPFVGCTILDAYVKCNLFAEAQEVFNRLLLKDVISWNALIMGYSEYGSTEDVLRCLEQMLSENLVPNSTTYVCCSKACSTLGRLSEGQKLHIEVVKGGLELDSAIGNSLVDMYMKCGAYLEGQEVFDKLLDRDVVSWTALILGCAEHVSSKTALEHFQQMQLEGIAPDEVLWNAAILSCGKQDEFEIALNLYMQMLEQGWLPNNAIWGSIVQACGDAAALELGKRFHVQSQEVNETILGTALVDMYSKCGSMNDAHRQFDAMLSKDMVAWDALIKGYARSAKVETAYYLLQNLTTQGMEPNESICLSFLTACSHEGLVQKGQVFFETMSKFCDISPAFGHYNAILDLLGRAGLLDEASATIHAVPSLIADPVPWGTVLGACKIWDNVELGESAFNLLLTLDDVHPGAFILMSNISAESHIVLDSD